MHEGGYSRLGEQDIENRQEIGIGIPIMVGQDRRGGNDTRDEWIRKEFEALERRDKAILDEIEETKRRRQCACWTIIAIKLIIAFIVVIVVSSQ